MTTHVDLIRGEKNFQLEFTIYEADGSVLDLTEGTPTFILRKYGVDQLSLLIDGYLPGPGSTGVCRFSLSTQLETLTPGDYDAEIEIDYDSGKLLKVPDITVLVKEDIRYGTT